MLCPKCDGETDVLDSRLDKKGRIRRRRKCKECEHRFSTLEIRIGELVETSHRMEH